MADIERHLDARMARRLTAEDRYLDRLERRERAAAGLVGRLVREGATVLYVNLRGRSGRTREFACPEAAVSFLLRNRYV